MTRRSVGGAARGPITPSPGSSPGVSIPFTESAMPRQLRRMLSSRDAQIDAMKRRFVWLSESDRQRLWKLDQERMLIRERIKAIAKVKYLKGGE